MSINNMNNGLIPHDHPFFKNRTHDDVVRRNAFAGGLEIPRESVKSCDGDGDGLAGEMMRAGRGRQDHELHLGVA